MLIPHLHFCENCREAIKLYEKAFGIICEMLIDSETYTMEINPNDTRGEANTPQEQVAHAVMKIHGQTIYLNDRFGNKAKSTDCAVHLIITFPSVVELLTAYEIFKPCSITVDELMELPYSKLAVQFIDRFGVQWGFMVEEEAK